MAVRQCRRTTRRGVRCSISSASRFCSNDEKRDLAMPLRRGLDYCLVHLPVLVTGKSMYKDPLIFYLDFETSGLDIFTDHIVEFGVLCDSGECFSTVCCPPVLTPGPHVHGIPNEELLAGPSFQEAFKRMMSFVDGLCLISVQSESSSDEESKVLTHSGLSLTHFRDPAPDVLIVAHNGRNFDFPFLLSECHRNSLSWERDLARWCYVDTLDLIKAIGVEVYGGCPKLQCLLQRTDCSGLQAHRALDC